MRKPRYKTICRFCKKEFEVLPYRKNTAKYCSRSCVAKDNPINQSKIKRNYGRDHWRWKPNGTKRKDGYISISIHGKRFFKHRYIMEQFLHRKLSKNETIHHINHIRSDNRIENLELISRSEHSHKYPAFRGGTITMTCKKCKSKFQCYKGDKRGGYCSKSCWYSRNK